MTAAATLVVGTGLVGTSAGLALQAAGRRVLLVDADPEALGEAQRRGAGTAWQPGERVDHVVIATPPAAVASVLQEVLGTHLGATVSDTASLKSLSSLQIETELPGLERFAGSHPMAGSERGGPTAARADLFVGRPWAITAYPQSGPEALEAAERVAHDCGATPVVLSPEEHDAAVALVSHLPQVAASALAATVGAHLSPAALRLIGAGLRDTTRIAASPAGLWADILPRNEAAVAGLAAELADRLARFAAALRSAGADTSTRELIHAGNEALRAFPGKHSAPPQPVEIVVAVLKDTPGALARLLADAHAAGVNVEDIRIEHASGAAIGAARLAVVSGGGRALAAALERAGWSVSVEAAELPE